MPISTLSGCTPCLVQMPTRNSRRRVRPALIPLRNLLTFPAAWRRIRAKVESKLSSARDRRLSQLRRREIEYRAKAEQYYSDILRQVLPVQRLYLPSLSQACELSCFREFMNLDRIVQPSEWVHAAGQLLESLSEWMSSHRDKYFSLLPFDSDGNQDKAMEAKKLSDPSIEVWRRVEMHSFAGRLELATSVFRHVDTETIHIGRDACHAWKMKDELEFLERGSEAVHALLQELHLGAETTTPSVLDQLDRRFVCASCPAELQRFHRSWRSCVSSRIFRFRNEMVNDPEYRFLILSTVRNRIIRILNGRR